MPESLLGSECRLGHLREGRYLSVTSLVAGPATSGGARLSRCTDFA